MVLLLLFYFLFAHARVIFLLRFYSFIIEQKGVRNVGAQQRKK